MEIKKKDLIKEDIELQDEEVTAYHGSPYSFKKFSTQNIGTGEGAQAFGWGLYFTDLEDVAKTYAEKLFPIKFPKPIYRIALNRVLEDVTNSKFGSGGKREFFDKKKAIEIINQKPFIQEVKDFLLDVIEKYDLKELKKNLYKVTLHKGKTPSQYTWLEWDKPMSDKALELFQKFNKEQGIKLSEPTEPIDKNDRMTAGQMYKWIADKIGQKQASLFLLENGIDGIKYPAESIARGATSDTARGFNYVVFDENAVSIEKQTQFEEMEIKKKDLIQNWLNNPKKLKEDAEDVNFIDEITKGELEEAKKKKADRCLRIARRKMPQTSAYRSGNVVRCRQGKIWKGLKEEDEFDIQEPEYALIEITKALAYMDDKYRYQLIPKSKLNNRLIDIKKGASGYKSISPNNVKVIETGNKSQLETKLKELQNKSLDEKWSEKYKRSIDCNNPKGFSQKAHCKGRLKEEDETKKGKIHFEHEHLANYSGQDNFELGIYEDDEVIGYVQYVIYNNEITVSDILVRPNRRREGFGSMLIKKMKQLHPYAKYKPSMKTDLGSKFIHKDVDVNESKELFQNKALDKLSKVGNFELLSDIDKLALLGGSNDERLKYLDLRNIYKQNGGTFGKLEIKVKIKDENKQPIKHKFSKEFASKEGYLFPYIHYNDENQPYVTVRFDEFVTNPKNFGGGNYEERPIMLANLYPIDYDKIKSDFVDYQNKTDFERDEFRKHFGVDDDLFEAKKTDFSKEKEQGLHGWFERQGGSGKSKGWVDCNTCRTVDGKKKCKTCGRQKGEKRAKYPACRPTPSACSTKGKGKSWGKKSKLNEDISNIKINSDYDINAIKFLFNEFPALKQIGSEEQYIEYLKSVFPENKTPILYKGLRNKSGIVHDTPNHSFYTNDRKIAEKCYIDERGIKTYIFDNKSFTVFDKEYDKNESIPLSKFVKDEQDFINNSESDVAILYRIDCGSLRKQLQFAIRKTTPNLLLGSEEDLKGFYDFVNKEKTQQEFLNESVKSLTKQDIEREIKLQEIKKLFKRHIGKI